MHLVRITLALALTACGGSSPTPPPVAPTPPAAAAPAGGIELGELTVFYGPKAVFKLHASGAAEFATGKDDWKGGLTIKADGTLEENGVAKAKINADGSISAVGGGNDKIAVVVNGDQATMPIDGGTLTMTIAADGKIGVTGLKEALPADQAPRVEGADTAGKRRTGLILVALTLTMMASEPAPAPATK